MATRKKANRTKQKANEENNNSDMKCRKRLKNINRHQNDNIPIQSK